jgi:hypothetical protein
MSVYNRAALAYLNLTVLSPKIMTSEPLPAEIELQIFTIAARTNYSDTTRLLRVARRVYAWIKPLLYESACLIEEAYAENFFRGIEAMPRSLAAASVKTLFIVGHGAARSPALSLCTGITFLSISTPIKYEFIEGLRPRRMNLQLGDLAGAPSDIYLDLPLFSHVTHLELYGAFLDKPFEILPCLTHLAINLWSISQRDVGYIGRILSECNRLEMLLILVLERNEIQVPHIKVALQGIRSSVPIFFDKMQVMSEDWNDYLHDRDPWSKAKAKANCIALLDLG